MSENFIRIFPTVEAAAPKFPAKRKLDCGVFVFDLPHVLGDLFFCFLHTLPVTVLQVKLMNIKTRQLIGVQIYFDFTCVSNAPPLIFAYIQVYDSIQYKEKQRAGRKKSGRPDRGSRFCYNQENLGLCPRFKKGGAYEGKNKPPVIE